MKIGNEYAAAAAAAAVMMTMMMMMMMMMMIDAKFLLRLRCMIELSASLGQPPTLDEHNLTVMF